jgi:hypothetical protein
LICVAVNQEPIPSMVDDQIGGVALEPIAGTDFNRSTVRSPDERKNQMENSIFSVL